MTQLKPYSATPKFDVDKIIEKFKWYEVVKRESIPQECIILWIEDFKNKDMSSNEVIRRIEKAAMRNTYGKTTFDSFFEDEDYKMDYDLMARRVLSIVKRNGIALEFVQDTEKYIKKLKENMLTKIRIEAVKLPTKEAIINLIDYYLQNLNKIK